jgi:hypothetical protein
MAGYSTLEMDKNFANILKWYTVVEPVRLVGGATTRFFVLLVIMPI